MSEGKLINPHGSDELKVLLLSGDEKNSELERAKSMKTVDITSRESGDLIMLGIGGFTPLDGFMGQDDWKSVTSDMQMSDGTFWPIPITLSVTQDDAESIEIGSEIALFSSETEEIMAMMKIDDKYSIDRSKECMDVFKTDDSEHPGYRLFKFDLIVSIRLSLLAANFLIPSII